MKIPGYELIALRRVVAAADALADAMVACKEFRVAGCDYELEYMELQAALDALPRHFERGRYIWKEIAEDRRQDSRGG